MTLLVYYNCGSTSKVYEIVCVLVSSHLSILIPLTIHKHTHQLPLERLEVSYLCHGCVLSAMGLMPNLQQLRPQAGTGTLKRRESAEEA